MTSAHDRFDVRVFLKECVSLATYGWSTTLLVADGKGDEVVKGVQVVDVGRPAGRWSRMTTIPARMLQRAMSMDADVYHLHDPELLLVGWRLKRRGKRVIFDSHEDVPKDILGKVYLVPALRRMVSTFYALFERWCCSRFDAVVAATPSIREHFEPFQRTTIDVNNYPMRSETVLAPSDADKQAVVCYVGGISAARGVVQLVEAMEHVTSGATLLLIGEFVDGTDVNDVNRLPGWRDVRALGQLDRSVVADHLAHAVAGVVTYMPEANHVNAQPNKLFEYMAAGVPVIASDFPLWRRIVEGHDCGICVDPQDPHAIASGIDRLVNDLGMAARLGANGLRAVREHFNWPVEEGKLLALYNRLVG